MKDRDRVLRELARFFLLTVGATAAFHFALVVFDLRFSLSPSSPALYLYLAGLATPAVAAIVVSGQAGRRPFLQRALSIRGSPGTFAAAFLAQAGLVLLAWLLSAAAGSSATPSLALAPGFAWIALGQLWVVLGEELGWRGFALPRLERALSPRSATLALALVWGSWHAPMFFVAGSLQAREPLTLFAASIFAWSAIHTALYHRSRPSVLPNLVFHACANITLNVGLVPRELTPYLLTAYLLAGAAVLAALRRSRGVVESPA